MGEWTTLSVRPETVDRFRNEMPEKVSSADEFVNLLLDVYDGEYDYDVEAIFERLSNLESTAGANNVQREELRREIRKAQAFAEEAKNNTEDIKRRMR